MKKFLVTTASDTTEKEALHVALTSAGVFFSRDAQITIEDFATPDMKSADVHAVEVQTVSDSFAATILFGASALWMLFGAGIVIGCQVARGGFIGAVVALLATSVSYLAQSFWTTAITASTREDTNYWSNKAHVCRWWAVGLGIISGLLSLTTVFVG